MLFVCSFAAATVLFGGLLLSAVLQQHLLRHALYARYAACVADPAFWRHKVQLARGALAGAAAADVAAAAEAERALQADLGRMLAMSPSASADSLRLTLHRAGSSLPATTRTTTGMMATTTTRRPPAVALDDRGDAKRAPLLADHDPDSGSGSAGAGDGGLTASDSSSLVPSESSARAADAGATRSGLCHPALMDAVTADFATARCDSTGAPQILWTESLVLTGAHQYSNHVGFLILVRRSRVCFRHLNDPFLCRQYLMVWLRAVSIINTINVLLLMLAVGLHQVRAHHLGSAAAVDFWPHLPTSICWNAQFLTKVRRRRALAAYWSGVWAWAVGVTLAKYIFQFPVVHDALFVSLCECPSSVCSCRLLVRLPSRR